MDHTLGIYADSPDADWVIIATSNGKGVRTGLRWADLRAVAHERDALRARLTAVEAVYRGLRLAGSHTFTDPYHRGSRHAEDDIKRLLRDALAAEVDPTCADCETPDA